MPKCTIGKKGSNETDRQQVTIEAMEVQDLANASESWGWGRAYAWRGGPEVVMGLWTAGLPHSLHYKVLPQKGSSNPHGHVATPFVQATILL